METRFFFLFLIFLFSCGSGKEDKIESGIDLALTHLSSDKCDEALDSLKDAEDLKDPIYLQVLASAYACKAGVNTVEVISELKNFSSVKVFNEITQKNFAQSTDLEAYQYLNKSLNTIFSSTTNVSQTERESTFGIRKGQDLGMQALLYSVVQISKFVNYFGNTTTGQKGDRVDGSGNTCFLDYANVPLLINLLPIQNSCQTVGDGHPKLKLDTSEGKSYACHAVTLINNTLDILDTIEFGNSQDLKVLKDISEKLSTLRDVVVDVDPSLVSLFDVRDSKACLELTDEEVETFIFALYEMGFE